MEAQQSKFYLFYDSPCGFLSINSNGDAITEIIRIKGKTNIESHPDKLCKLAKNQLEEYFEGNRNSFDIPIDLESGTPFQQSVWRQLRLIPYGKTTTYGRLANHLNNPKAVRAVGTANGKNPILIIVPCHRVLGSDGSLVGFSAGIDMKKDLLSLESRAKIGVQASLF